MSARSSHILRLPEFSFTNPQMPHKCSCPIVCLSQHGIRESHASSRPHACPAAGREATERFALPRGGRRFGFSVGTSSSEIIEEGAERDPRFALDMKDPSKRSHYVEQVAAFIPQLAARFRMVFGNRIVTSTEEELADELNRVQNVGYNQAHLIAAFLKRGVVPVSEQSSDSNDHTGVIARLADFGLCASATHTGREGAEDGLAAIRGGTPGWMAPQQLLQCCGCADGRPETSSDIWSLGLVVSVFMGGPVGKAARQCVEAGQKAWQRIRALRQRDERVAAVTAEAEAMVERAALVIAAAEQIMSGVALVGQQVRGAHDAVKVIEPHALKRP